MLAAQTRKEIVRLFEQAKARAPVVAGASETSVGAAPKEAAVKAAETVVPDVTPPDMPPADAPPVDTQSGGWFSWLTGSGAPASDKEGDKKDDEKTEEKTEETTDVKTEEGMKTEEKTEESKTTDETEQYDDCPARQAAKKQPCNVTYGHLQACFLALEAVALAAKSTAVKSESTSDTAAEAAIFAADQREQIVYSLPMFAQLPLVSNYFKRVSAKLYHAGHNDLSHDLFMVIDEPPGFNMPVRASESQQDAGDYRCAFLDRDVTLTPKFVNELRAKEGLSLLAFSDEDGEAEAAQALRLSCTALADKDKRAYFCLLAAVVTCQILKARIKNVLLRPSYHEAFQELAEMERLWDTLPTDPIDVRMLSAAGLMPEPDDKAALAAARAVLAEGPDAFARARKGPSVVEPPTIPLSTLGSPPTIST